MKEKTTEKRCASCLCFQTNACEKDVKWNDKACGGYEKNDWLGRIMTGQMKRDVLPNETFGKD
ncbi:hypothetical protein EZS27_009186 [termite gut metagenome]|uniref:Uncharacterized protein n=1 Tax=termite gut metagenome TaxID=433724 RepID=A0A5J4SCP6_9ZZZZ